MKGTGCLHFLVALLSRKEHINTYILYYTIRKNTGALVIAVREISLEVNAEKTKYMVMSRDQNARQNTNIQVGNKSF